MQPNRSKPEPVSVNTQPLGFVDSTYRDALQLTREARDYLAHQEAQDSSRLEPLDRLVASCEAMRLTARMTEIMAWLLVQRAVQEGELSAEEASDERYRMSCRDICMENEPVARSRLPEGLIALLERSRLLYHRIVRLDRQYDALSQ